MCYTYDSLNRVTNRIIKDMANVVISTEGYTYDAAGNITDAPDSCFIYDNNNRLTTFNGNAVSYDLDGNMLSDGCATFEYDSANRLITADGHTYTYNAEDVRIRNLCSDADTTYTYNTNCRLSQLLQKTTNNTTTKYVYGHGLIGEDKCGEFKTYHFDYRGSTVAITDDNGNIIDTFKYDTYGNVTEHIGNSFVILGYNGRDGVVTDRNGLLYMRARYYSPEMRRFVNADILHGEISDSTSLNRYAYVNGNPVSFVDPFGLSAERGFIVSNNKQNDWLDLYGAIYVVDYGEYGLPIVGHSYLYLKDENGCWHKTEFAGSKPSNATVDIWQVSKENIIKSLSRQAEMSYYYDYEYKLHFGAVIPILTRKELGYTDGVQYFAIKGDFKDSIDLANEYKNNASDYGGYNLFVNNCLDYSQEILRAGTADMPEIESFIENTDKMVPGSYFEAINKYKHIQETEQKTKELNPQIITLPYYIEDLPVYSI